MAIGYGGYATMEDYKRAKGYAASDANQSFGNRAPPPNVAMAKEEDTSVGDILGSSLQGNPRAQQIDPRAYQYGGAAGKGDEAFGRYTGMGAQAAGQQAYQMNDQAQRAARSYQNYAAGDYVNSLTGKNPSFANQQMQRGLGQAQANNFSIARSGGGSGINQASAMRAALRGNQSMANSTNQEAGLQAIREREAARQGLAAVGGQMRGQDIGWEQGKASNEMAQRGLNANQQMGYERLGADVRSQELQASQNYARSAQEAEQKQREANAAVERYNADSSTSAIGAIGTAIGGIFGMSDERGKKSISGAGMEMSVPKEYQDSISGESEAAAARKSRSERFQRAFDDSFKPAGSDKASQDANSSMASGIGALGGGIGKLAGMASSDEDCKKGMAGGKLADYARSLKPKTFLYKDEPAGTPKRLGVMAQDMEESEIGESTVSDTPAGKMVHMPRAVSAALASVGEMRKELDALKKTMRKGKKKKKSDDDEDD